MAVPDPGMEPKLHAVNPPKPKAPVQEMFDRTITAATLAHQSGNKVTPEALHAIDQTYTPETYSQILQTPKLLEALEARGISADPMLLPTAEQMYAIQVMVDPSMGLSPYAKLRKLGIPWAQWQGWLHQPAFSRIYRSLSERILTESIPAALTRLEQLADAGDLKAIKLSLELTGRYNPNAQAAVDFNALLADVLEAVQTTVKDDREYAQVVAKIAAKTGLAGVAMPGLPELEATVVDEELPSPPLPPEEPPLP
jgi:hypothetical protein